ncbi:MAG: riboflavin kinase [Marmoricola sp.]|nr:riboflavin kinase [Marmoricola sp.]
MRTWRSLDEVPDDLGRTVTVVGNFDGVHLGHQHVVRRARELADQLATETSGEPLPVVAVTFDPHPMAVLRPEHAPTMLTTSDRRCELLAAAGVDDVLVVPFSREVAAWSPQEFVDRILVGSLHARAVVVGANFRFGARAAGDVAFLTVAGREADFLAEGIDLDGGPQVWSSTYVRTCVAEGDVEGAAEALGRPFSVVGVVVQGEQRGRELGYPTANVPVTGVAAPADGVYAGRVRVRRAADGGTPGDVEPWPAAISVGTNPTFAGERERRVEAYVLDRTDLALYGSEVEVTFEARIRGMVAYEGVEPLLVQMADDVARTRTLLG